MLDGMTTPRTLRNLKLSDLTLDPAISPGPGCTSPRQVDDWSDVIGATITKVTRDRTGLTVTMRTPGEPGPRLSQPLLTPISFGFRRRDGEPG